MADPRQQPQQSGSWPAWQQPPGGQAAPPVPHPGRAPQPGQAAHPVQPPYTGQAPYPGQAPYWGQPPLPEWPKPLAYNPQVKSPPDEHPKELPWRLAGWWSRVGAQLLDVLIVWLPGAALIVPLVAAADSADGTSERTLLILTIVASFLVMAAHLFYAPLLMRRGGRRNGQTIGKQAAGIRVIRADGEPMRFADAALRQIVFKSFGGIVASTFIPLFPWILNYLWPTWDEQHRALHDLAADTRVVAA